MLAAPTGVPASPSDMTALDSRPPEASSGEATPLRVLWITSAYPANDADPRGIFIRTMARSLAAAGVRLTVLAPASPDTADEEVWEGVRIVRARYWRRRSQGLAVGVAGIVPNLRARPLLFMQVPVLLFSLSRHALRLAPEADLIHAHWIYPSGIAAWVAARRQRKPFVVTSHGGDLNLADRVPPLRLLCRAVARRATASIAVSRALAARFTALGVPARRVHLIPYGVDAAEDARPPEALAARPEYRRLRSARAFRVLYVGSLIPRKSVRTILEAHALLERRGHTLLTTIIGAGPEDAGLRRFASQAGLREVTFVGQEEPGLIPHWMRAADVLVLPSKSEGRPVVVLQAMAAGLAVVASDIPGTRDLVEDGATGCLFPPGSSAALADALARLETDPEHRHDLVRAALSRIEGEDLFADGIARRHLRLYEAIVINGGARVP